MGDVESSIRQLLPHMDGEPGREGLQDTPKRYEKFVHEFFEPEPFKLTTFDNEGYDEMVLQTDIPFYSILRASSCCVFRHRHHCVHSRQADCRAFQAGTHA